MCEKCEKTETAVERLAKYCKDQKISAPVYTQTHNVNGVVRVMCEVSGLNPVSQPGISYDDAKEQAEISLFLQIVCRFNLSFFGK